MKRLLNRIKAILIKQNNKEITTHTSACLCRNNNCATELSLEKESITDNDPKYYAKVLNQIDNGKGYWEYQQVGIIEKYKDREETKIGEYQRNYSSGGEKTFYPFKLKGKWYALYSKHYMYTRVMSLPNCVDLGGEEDSNTEYRDHFCPGEYYVPELCVQYNIDSTNDPEPISPNHQPEIWAEKKKDGEYYLYIWPNDKESKASEEKKLAYNKAKEKAYKEHDEWLDRHPFITKSASFGFVGGCSWGDDCSWKIEFLDLREADKGIVKRDARYGYLEIPANCKLKDVIDVESIDYDSDWSKMTLQLARPFRVNVDGSYNSWWVDEYFKKLEKKYKGKLSSAQLIEIKNIFEFFFKHGLDDSGTANDTLSKIDELITTIKP